MPLPVLKNDKSHFRGNFSVHRFIVARLDEDRCYLVSNVCNLRPFCTYAHWVNGVTTPFALIVKMQQ